MKDANTKINKNETCGKITKENFSADYYCKGYCTTSGVRYLSGGGDMTTVVKGTVLYCTLCWRHDGGMRRFWGYCTIVSLSGTVHYAGAKYDKKDTVASGGIIPYPQITVKRDTRVTVGSKSTVIWGYCKLRGYGNL